MLVGRAPVKAFGKVIQSYKTRGSAGVMHVMFTRVTAQHLNRISEFVYEFSTPSALAMARAAAETPPARAGRGTLQR